jgi:response regulator NasT
MEEKKIVDQAKAILMNKYKVNEAQAYEKMRKVSMDKRMSLKKLAELIISEK